MNDSKTSADYYIEISFNNGAGNLAPGATTGEIQTRINKNNWSNYNELNDYSYDATKTSYTEWNKVVLLNQDSIVWGIEP
ncbi:Endoglucanase 5 precursor [compost metagenome]